MDCSTQASLSSTISQSLLKFMSSEFVILSNHRILCHPLLLPSIFPSIRVFLYELALHIRWPKYWSLNISPSNEYSKLISFRTDWFDLLVVQGHHVFSSITIAKHRFLCAQPSLWSKSQIHTWSLTIWNCVSKMMSLLFNMLSQIVIAFLKGTSVF